MEESHTPKATQSPRSNNVEDAHPEDNNNNNNVHTPRLMEDLRGSRDNTTPEPQHNESEPHHEDQNQATPPISPRAEEVHSPEENDGNDSSDSPETASPGFSGSPSSPYSPERMRTVKSMGATMTTNFEEDGALKQRLVESTVLRKKAEGDAKVLANRIALLEVEERKAMKKVEEARKKAQEVMALKNRNLAYAKQKAELKKEREEEERKKLQQNKIFKEQIRMNQEQKKIQLQKELKSGVNDIKNQKKGFMEKLTIHRNEELAKNMESVQKIKHSERQLQEMKKHQIEETKEKAKQTYEKKIEKEQFKRKETYMLISQLEQREQDLIKKLQATQNLQKAAFDDLEKVLAAPAEE